MESGAEIEGKASDLVRYNRTVSQAFTALWDRIDEEVRDAWRLAACFEPEPVTAELSDAVGLTGPRRRRLQRLHLIEVDAEGRWWMHRLTREFGLRAGSEGDLVAAKKAFIIGCADFAQRIELADGFRPYLANRAHLDAAVQLAPEMLNPTDSRVSGFQDRLGTGLTAPAIFAARRGCSSLPSSEAWRTRAKRIRT